MDADTLTQKLKWCKRELLALKTAHQRGLGTASFFSDTDFLSFAPTSYANNFLYITVQFDSLPYSPYCQCYISSAQYFQPMEITYDTNANQMIFVFMSYLLNVTIPVNAKVIATAEIKSITMTGGSYA